MGISSAHKSASRPTSWWLAMLRRRAERMYHEKIDLSRPVEWESEEERQAAIRFFNAAYRAEESGCQQAHALAEEVAAWDAELAEVLRLYGNEERWHKELLTDFLQYIGGEVRPMGPTTSTFYNTYMKAKRIESIVITNLMFETIGSTTYRLALRNAKNPTIRHQLQILTRDEAFHVPLNVHFLREALKHRPESARRRMKVVYNVLFPALVASSYASRRRTERFDKIPFRELSRAYAQHLGELFLHEPDLRLRPPELLLRALGLSSRALSESDSLTSITIEAAEKAVDREKVHVAAL